MRKITKSHALRILQDVEREQGEHNGRWEDEYCHEEISIIYFEQMLGHARFIGLNCSDDPTTYYEEWEEDDVIEPGDTAGFIIKEKLVSILKNIILEE